MTPNEAKKNGYKAITFPYKAGEDELMSRVTADMERGGIDHIVVDVSEGKEVWRR